MEHTVVVVDDDEVTRLVISRGLAGVEGFQVVAEGESGAEAITLAQEHEPDVLLLCRAREEGRVTRSGWRVRMDGARFCRTLSEEA